MKASRKGLAVRARARARLGLLSRVQLGIRRDGPAPFLTLLSFSLPRSRGSAVRRKRADPRLDQRRRLIGVNEAGEKRGKTPAAAART